MPQFSKFYVDFDFPYYHRNVKCQLTREADLGLVYHTCQICSAFSQIRFVTFVCCSQIKLIFPTDNIIEQDKCHMPRQLSLHLLNATLSIRFACQSQHIFPSNVTYFHHSIHLGHGLIVVGFDLKYLISKFGF